MKNNVSIFVKILLSCMVFLQMSSLALATQPGDTVLPFTAKTVKECREIFSAVNQAGLTTEQRENYFTGFGTELITVGGVQFTVADWLACGIKTGQMSLWMIPYYIRFILEFVVGIAGLVAVGGVVYGGYLYLFAGVSEDKDKGKKAILYGVVGMVMTMVAWAVVNIVISVVTA